MKKSHITWTRPTTEKEQPKWLAHGTRRENKEIMKMLTFQGSKNKSLNGNSHEFY